MARLVIIATVVLCANVSAHLNHIQFAAIDEAHGKLHVRYRMSADMFMSNVDADIKAGRLTESVKQRPISDIIQSYFRTHLLLELNGAANAADSATFEFDAKTSDWIADFIFPAPPENSKPTLICDAFLENNPRTQTLARITWRGENTMFHFRTGNVRYALGSSLQAPSENKAAPASPTIQFLDGLARALKAYDFLAAGSLVLIVLGQMLSKLPRPVIALLAIPAAVALSLDQCGRDGILVVSGFALGWSAVVVTLFHLSSSILQTHSTSTSPMEIS